MVVFYLLFAHLFGDFVSQSNDLIQRKYKSWIGNFEHVCIIAFFTILVLFPYWCEPYAWLAIITIFATHFLQDLIKIKYDLKYNEKQKSVVPFFLDQVIHIALIVYLAQVIQNLQPLNLPATILNIYSSPFLITYLLGLVLFSYAYDITFYQFNRQKSKIPLAYKPNFPAMRSRITVFSIIAVLLLVVYRSGM